MKMRIPYPAILNERSLCEVACRTDFVSLVKGLVAVVRAMAPYGYGLRLAYSYSVMSRKIFEGNTFASWLSLSGCQVQNERELVILVKAMMDRGCVLENVGLTSDDDLYFQGIRIYGGDVSSVPGLAASYIWNLPSTALNIGIYCGCGKFDLEREYLHVDGTIHKDCVPVKVLSTVDAVKSSCDDLMSRLLSDIQNGVDLVSAVRTVMPKMSLSKGVVDSLKTISFRQFPVVSEFFRLNEVFNRCLAVGSKDFFNEYGALKSIAMSESDTKMAEHPYCRNFTWDDGTVHKCEPHVKVGNGCRIHFFPDFADEKLYVGYVGPHLEP